MDPENMFGAYSGARAQVEDTPNRPSDCRIGENGLEPGIRGDFRSDHPQVRIRIEVPLSPYDRGLLRVPLGGVLRVRVRLGPSVSLSDRSIPGTRKRLGSGCPTGVT